MKAERPDPDLSFLMPTRAMILSELPRENLELILGLISPGESEWALRLTLFNAQECRWRYRRSRRSYSA